MTLIFSKKISLQWLHNSSQIVFLLHVKSHKDYMTFEGFNSMNEYNIKFSSPHLSQKCNPSSWIHLGTLSRTDFDRINLPPEVRHILHHNEILFSTFPTTSANQISYNNLDLKYIPNTWIYYSNTQVYKERSCPIFLPSLKINWFYKRRIYVHLSTYLWRHK